MTPALWFDAAIAALGLTALMVAIFGKGRADDEAARAFLFFVAAALIAASLLFFIVIESA